MKNNIHQEFEYQARELGIQIEDTLGEPPDRKYYARVITSLIGEYAKGTGIDDVNMLSFALADHLSFDDPVSLLADCKQYEKGKADKVVSMVSCADADAAKALATISATDPELTRKAILTAFLFKNMHRWAPAKVVDEQADEDENEQNFDDGDEDDRGTPGQDVIDLFDKREDRND